ncbi:hypothetical protein C9374_002818 [Naegleria lovaniensis]|uniref:Uncharacterized protein n=1 Tax=Naegleria lovaniensis TaxID=51637 RepID=A0AA88GSS9_NAELO|nr:uncharacterized protein C9374_002818 [Naegleria lovaniensis]KAG2386372.1 hypothetical protein C9374_002818 [Naegleria lovaniensis]
MNLSSPLSLFSFPSTVFCCGYNTDRFLGVKSDHGPSDLFSLVHLSTLENEMKNAGAGYIVQVSTKFSKSYFLTSNHHVYIGRDMRRWTWPDLLLPDKIVDIKTGQNSALFLMSSGKVYMDTDSGNPCLFEKEYTAKMIAATGMSYWILDVNNVLRGTGELLSNPVESPIDLKAYLDDDEDVAELVTGGSSICIITNRRNLYILGEKVAFGMSDTSIYKLPHRMHRFDGMVNKVSCGWYFTMVLAIDHSLHGAGRNTYGQLSNPNTDQDDDHTSGSGAVTRPAIYEQTTWKEFTPHLPPGEFVENICCGSDHVVIATNKGKVLTKGMTTYGQIGRRDRNEVFDLPNFHDPNYEDVIKNAVGENYTARFASNNFNTLSTYVIYVPSISKQLIYFKEKMKTAFMDNKLTDLSFFFQ